jgi:hypothetical protein
MKILVSVCLVALLFCLGLAWWARSTQGPAVDGRVDAVLNNQVRPGVTANRALSSGWQGPPRWVPSDAERVDDRGALLTWVATDAERVEDSRVFLTWVPTDAERNDDQGAFLTWIATDAERDDDVGVLMHGSSIDCERLPAGRQAC